MDLGWKTLDMDLGWRTVEMDLGWRAVEAQSVSKRGAGEEMPTIPRQTFTPAKYAIGLFISLQSRYS